MNELDVFECCGLRLNDFVEKKISFAQKSIADELELSDWKNVSVADVGVVVRGIKDAHVLEYNLSGGVTRRQGDGETRRRGDKENDPLRRAMTHRRGGGAGGHSPTTIPVRTFVDSSASPS